MSISTPVATTELMFQPVQVGRNKLAHRIVMAPLTRSRARQPGNIPSPPQCLLLRPTCVCRSDHFRGHAGLPAGPRLRLDAGYSHPRAGRGMAVGYGCGTQSRRADLLTALARWAGFSPVATARWYAAGGAIADSAFRRGVHRGRKRRGCIRTLCDAARSAA